MFLYIVWYKPFKEWKDNWLNLYNESVIILVFLALIWINNSDYAYNNVSTIGWILIVLIMLSFVTTWAIMMPGVARGLWEAVTGLFKKSAAAGKEGACTEKQVENDGEVLVEIKTEMQVSTRRARKKLKGTTGKKKRKVAKNATEDVKKSKRARTRARRKKQPEEGKRLKRRGREGLRRRLGHGLLGIQRSGGR